MSHSPSAPTSSSVLMNLIHTTSGLPLAKAMGNFMTKTGAAFEYATSLNPESRFTAVMIATIMTAGGIWGIQFTLGRIPFHFVRRILVPVGEWSLKSGLSWVIFTALKASVREVNGGSLHERDAEDHRGEFHSTPRRDPLRDKGYE